ncbi:molybdopterin biosynthesis protein [Stenotrophomonas chelatiphaga]|uniref:Molybdopterin molybdenumtransferase n=1 Tax=Stenotrophomonas chelatiphaga TaxID=517011 RepID=A0A0R0DIR5_9GAMM|nr:molybdopterin molybdotransferase MoeA [Stenotrophomonas chelatiphaga]KRG77475.1 molybdopterin biosynthesis protein [Stenotrophomonas chelatiphaga]
MIAYAEALRIVMEAAALLPDEAVALDQACGRTLSAPVYSPQCVPPFDNSAMDGFALRLDGSTATVGSEFDVAGWQAAGDAASVAGNGAWEIMTGARLPDGLDSVVPVEQVEILCSEGGRPLRIRLRANVAPQQFVRLRGQDVQSGEQVLAEGECLDLNALSLLHAIGAGQVRVRVRPRAAVIATGKELVSQAGQALQSGQIRDSSRPALIARLQLAGAQVVADALVGDDAAAFDQAMDQALAGGAHVLVSTGAVSAGRYDFIPAALQARGAQILFHKVAIRPGKPVLFARLPCGALYFGLPGNPVSTAVGQRFFVEPLLRGMLGLPAEIALRLPLLAAADKPEGLRFHARARVEVDASGQLGVRVLAGQESFRLKSSLQANAWAVLDEAGSHAPAGTQVQVMGWGHATPLQVNRQEQA